MAATPLMSTTPLPVTVQRTQARAHLHLAHETLRLQEDVLEKRSEILDKAIEAEKDELQRILES